MYKSMLDFDSEYSETFEEELSKMGYTVLQEIVEIILIILDRMLLVPLLLEKLLLKRM
jgi:hypothetical protein